MNKSPDMRLPRRASALASPHQARISGVMVRVQTAWVVLCYSRMIFFQMYPRFTRFECKAFLAQAIHYFQGCARRCMVD